MAVRVGQVLHGDVPVDSLRGDTVTVVSRDSTAPAVGSRAVFFTHGLTAGRTLVVQEVKRLRLATDGDVSAIRLLVAAAEASIADTAILRESKAADAVVLARIDSITPIALPDSITRRARDHMPEWNLATGRVLVGLRRGDSVFRNRRIAVLFTDGDDSFTEFTPRLEVGKRHVLWLRRLWRLPRSLRLGIDTTDRYYVLDSDDAQTDTAAMRIARLLGATFLRAIGSEAAQIPPPVDVKRPNGKLP
jgi:hypothetical protein